MSLSLSSLEDTALVVVVGDGIDAVHLHVARAQGLIVAVSAHFVRV